MTITLSDQTTARLLQAAAWVHEIKPLFPAIDGTNGMHRVFGAWPGDETDEEAEALLQKIDDEDAGRAKKITTLFLFVPMALLRHRPLKWAKTTYGLRQRALHRAQHF